MAGMIDPKLATAIRKGKPRDENVHAAFTLRNDGKGKALTPERTDEIVKDIVDRASRHTAKAVNKVVVFKNLQSFSIDAPATLVEKLVGEDAVSTAALGS